MKTIALLYGGKSQEHEVSRISAASIVKHLDRSKYNILLIGITQTGYWYLQDQATTDEKSLPIVESASALISIRPEQGLFCGEKNLGIDVCFPVLHGNFGEDGKLQGLLETADVPYTGAGVLGSAIGMDKTMAKQVWEHHGLPVVPSVCLEKGQYPENADLWDEISSKLGTDVFVKPVCSGSSVGINRARDRATFQDAVKEAFTYDWRILIEKTISAREVECSVTGNENPQAYVPGEIAPHHEFYDFDAKYIDPDGAALLIPSPITPSQTEQVRSLAVKAYKVLGLEGYARVDFFMDKNDSTLYINEVNTLPGFTSISMFPMMCAEAGLKYSELLDHLIDLALLRHNRSHNIKYSRT